MGGDDFDVDIVNIGFIKREKFFLGENTIIVDLDDIDELENHLKTFVNSIKGHSWENVLDKLREFFKWEYEKLELI